MARQVTDKSVAAAMSRLPAAERITHGIARFTLRHRWPTLAILTIITVFFAFHAVKVQMYSQFADLLPQAIRTSRPTTTFVPLSAAPTSSAFRCE